MKNEISVLILALIFIFSVAVSGCTGLNSGQSSNNPQEVSVSQTNTPVETQAEIVQPTVSWKDFYPDYDEQTKSEKIEDAKDEIIRVFPDVDRSTLKGEWVDHRYLSKNGNYGFPVIRFENVNDTSVFYTRIHGDKNIVEILVDPIVNEIVSYKPSGYSTPFNVEEKLTFDEGIEKSLDLIENIKHSDSINKNSESLIFDERDLVDNYDGGLINLFILGTYKEIPYLYDSISILYDAYADKVSLYSDKMLNKDFLHEMTTLSSVPEITNDEAKRLVKARINEEYNVDNLGIEFKPVDTVKYPDSLVWYNNYRYLFFDNSEAVPLAWYLQFNDLEERKNNPDNKYQAFVDAHTGEILSLSYKDIRIPAL